MQEDLNTCILDTVYLLYGLSAKDKELFHQSAELHLVEKGKYIFFTGDYCDYVYFLAQGRVKIGNHSDEGREIIKAINYPGEMFGEIGLVGVRKRDSFAQAINEDCSFYRMHIRSVWELMRKSPELAMRINKQLVNRLRRSEQRLEELTFKDARTRVIRFLEETARKNSSRPTKEISLKDFLSQQEIANLTATSRQTVSTVLNELKKQEVIYFDRKHIRIGDLSQLE